MQKPTAWLEITAANHTNIIIAHMKNGNLIWEPDKKIFSRMQCYLCYIANVCNMVTQY